MCGIFGYCGTDRDVNLLASTALAAMEYRGYDSWGIAAPRRKRMSVHKQTGRIANVQLASHDAPLVIGHTRWATHGGVTRDNAHPHLSTNHRFAVVHNGVIENDLALRDAELANVPFRSQTDSELVAHLVAKFVDHGADFADAVRQTWFMLQGSSAIVVADARTNSLAAVTRSSPLRLAHTDSGWVMASDPAALAPHADSMAVIPDETLIVCSPTDVSITDVVSGEDAVPHYEPIHMAEMSTRGEFSHFTLKEIHDQIDLVPILADRVDEVHDLRAAIDRAHHVILTGCGSAGYAAAYGGVLLEPSCQAWVDVIPASEINETTRNRGSDTLMIALSQSGETADIIDAIHHAHTWGASTAAIVNVPSSTVASMVERVVPLDCGQERSVLATKSFAAMLVRMQQLANGAIPINRAALNDAFHRTDLGPIVEAIAAAQTVLCLGRGLGRPIAQEAALKIKEGSYVHAEAYLTGELKHGPLALVERGTPALLFATDASQRESARIASREIMARGGCTMAIGEFDDHDANYVIHVSDDTHSMGIVHVMIAQRVAFEVALRREKDPDFPRNLAKSVTVR